MDYEQVSEAIRGNMRDCALRGKRLPHPDVEALWDALGGDGYMTLLVTLDYMTARAELQDEIAASVRAKALAA